MTGYERHGGSQSVSRLILYGLLAFLATLAIGLILALLLSSSDDELATNDETALGNSTQNPGAVDDLEIGSETTLAIPSESQQPTVSDFDPGKPGVVEGHSCSLYKGYATDISRLSETGSHVKTKIPVYDTGWSMFSAATKTEVDEYYAKLKADGFTGTWTVMLFHNPVALTDSNIEIGTLGGKEDGRIFLNQDYIDHIRYMLDKALEYDLKVGVLPAWQLYYFPDGRRPGDEINSSNAYDFGQLIAAEFGNHPAISSWVFGGDPYDNQSIGNLDIWSQVACGMRDAGDLIPIGFHTNDEPDQAILDNLATRWWLDFVAPQTGHNKDARQAEASLNKFINDFSVPVWQGEARYFNSEFEWVREDLKRPGAQAMVDDALASLNSGAKAHLYGDAGRFHWCRDVNGWGKWDISPCDPTNIVDSFGSAELQVIEALS